MKQVRTFDSLVKQKQTHYFMETTIEVIEVEVEKNPVQINTGIGAQVNFKTYEKGWEPGCVWSCGATLDEAIANFKESWMLKHDTEIEVKVIETKIV